MSFTRRQALSTFVISAGALATSSLAGCFAKKKARHSPNHFPQSVMTGDPTPNSVVFWTRIEASEATRRVKLHLSKMGDNAVYETPMVTTSSVQDGIVKLKLVDLEPNTTYQYHFEYVSKAGKAIATSKTGTTKTAPSVDSEQPIRFAFASCQDFNGRYFNPYLSILNDAESFDFLVHLGDYIYETTGDPNFQLTTGGRTIRFDDQQGAMTLYAKNGAQGALTFQAANSLDNYRQLYREYRRDPILQQVHERMAMIAIWDDHEFSDDSYGATATYYDAVQDETNTARKHHAEQAYFEYMPIDRAPYISIKGSEQTVVALNAETDLFPNTQVYRSFQFGKHLSIFLADTRSFRKDHLIPENASLTRSAISSEDISDVEDVFIELAAAQQIDIVRNFLPETVYQDLKKVEEKMLTTPLTDATRPLFKRPLHQKILALLEIDTAIHSINHLLYNTQLIIKETLDANGHRLNDFTASDLDALQLALRQRTADQPQPQPSAASNATVPSISDREMTALKSALVATLDASLILITDNLEARKPSQSLKHFITDQAMQALFSTLQTDVFYKPLLERVLLLSEFSLKTNHNNPLFLFDNQLETLYDILTKVATNSSPVTLLDEATDYPEMKKNIVRDLEQPQSLGVLIKTIRQFIENAQQKGLNPNPAIHLLDTLKAKAPDLVLEHDSNSAFYTLRDDIISVPFAALGHLAAFSDIGSRYLVVKDRFELYALVKMLTSKPIAELVRDLSEDTNNDKQVPTRALQSMLGTQQTQQLTDFLTQQQSTWKIFGSSISTTPMVADFRSKAERQPNTNIDNDEQLNKVLAALPEIYQQRFYINVDQWDGYPIEKNILQRLLADTHTIAIAGDVHAAYVSTFEAGRNTLIELTTPAISSLEVGGMMDQGLDKLLQGTAVEDNIALLKAHYNEMVINAPKYAPDGDPLRRSAIQLAETRVQGIAVVEVTAAAMRVEYRMVAANHDAFGYLPTQSFYQQPQDFLKLVRKTAFKVTRNDQGDNVLEPL